MLPLSQVRSSNCRSGNLNIVKIKYELVGAVEVTDGHITLLTCVATQINDILIPVTLITLRTLLAWALLHTGSCCQRPFIKHGEGRSFSIVRCRNSYTEVFCSIAGILCTNIEIKYAA